MRRVVALNSCNTGRRAVYLPVAVSRIQCKIGDPVVENVKKLDARCTADSDGSFEREIRAVLAESDKCGLAAARLAAAAGNILRIVAVFNGSGA